MNSYVPSRTIFKWAVAGTLGVAAVVIGLLSLWALRDILVLILIAMFVAVSLDPAVRWLVRHGIKRPFAVTIVALLTFAVAVAIVWSLVPAVVNQGGKITTDLPGYVTSLDERSKAFRELSERYGLAQQLNQLAAGLPARIGSSVLGFFKTFLGVLGTTLLVMVISIYFMADLPRIRRSVPELFPESYRTRAHQITDIVVDKVGSYMIGNLIISAIAGVVTFIGLTLIGVPFALPLALWVAVTDLIPLIGATLGAVVCILVAFIAGGLWPAGILTVLLFVLYQQLENYFIAPRVMRYSMAMPAVVVLLAGLAGAALLGLIGALMAIPIAAAVKTVWDQVRNPSSATDEAAPEDSEAAAEAG